MTRIPPQTRQTARALRRNPTPMEKRVWARLRDFIRSTSLHFRRQAPIGLYIVNFVEFSQGLIIEIDGGQHDATTDQPRADWLKNQGFRVLRFWNSDVSENLDGVIQTILDATTYSLKPTVAAITPLSPVGRDGVGGGAPKALEKCPKSTSPISRSKPVPVIPANSPPQWMAAPSRRSATRAATQFGANIVTLAPGALSSLRHWHEQQDEILVVISGKLTLVDDTGDTRLLPGDVAAFPAGDENGHHLINKSDTDAKFFVVGTRTPTETGWYSDHDMKVTADQSGFHFTRRDGSPLPGSEP